MTVLPFADASFDLVVSSLAIHNVKGKSGRNQVMEETIRVLRPGGRLMLADLFSTREYFTHLARFGMADVSRRNLGWRVWWSGPWLPTFLTSASKKTVGSEK